VAEAEQQMENEHVNLVKMKVRAAYKANKSKQRVKPAESSLR